MQLNNAYDIMTHITSFVTVPLLFFIERPINLCALSIVIGLFKLKSALSLSRLLFLNFAIITESVFMLVLVNILKILFKICALFDKYKVSHLCSFWCEFYGIPHDLENVLSCEQLHFVMSFPDLQHCLNILLLST